MINLNNHIATAITDVFTGNNWTDQNIQNGLADVDFKMAQQKIPFTENTIAKILYHLKYSNEVVLERANGNPVQYDNDALGFAAPEICSEQDWQHLIQKTFFSSEKLAEALRKFPEEKMFEPILPGFSTAYKTFHGIVEHAHYHLGQIIMIKKYLQSQ